jgi:hypothetical protein
MAKDPDERFQSATEVIEFIDHHTRPRRASLLRQALPFIGIAALTCSIGFLGNLLFW